MSQENSAKKLLLVRVQDDLHGARHDGEKLILNYDRETFRNTMHFTVNSIVSDHAYGNFNVKDGELKGKVVIVADARDMPPPAGWGQVDAWWRLRSEPAADGTMQRSLPVGNATIVAPAGTEVPQGSKAVFYTGGIEARDTAVAKVVAEQGVQLERNGFWSWQSSGANTLDQWQRETTSAVWPGKEQHIFLGPHSASLDETLETYSLRGGLKALRDGERLHADSSGAERPYVEVMEENAASIKANIHKLLSEVAPPEERALIALHYQEQLRAVDADLKLARELDQRLVERMQLAASADVPPPLAPPATAPVVAQTSAQMPPPLPEPVQAAPQVQGASPRPQDAPVASQPGARDLPVPESPQQASATPIPAATTTAAREGEVASAELPQRAQSGQDSGLREPAAPKKAREPAAAADFTTSGAFNINGQFATAIKFEAQTTDNKISEVAFRFMNGRTEVAAVKLEAEDAKDLVGETNFKRIEKTAAKFNASEKSQDGGPAKGELRGKTLEFRQVMLPEYQATASENAIYADTKKRDDHLTARDVAVGAAHGAQLASGGNSAVHSAATVVGALDAAQVAADLAAGKDVRPMDAAAAAASVTVGSGLGGPAVQGVAQAAQAASAVDTAVRGARTAVDAAKDQASERGEGAPAVNPQDQAKLQQLRASAIPDAISERFLRIEDKYYFPDKSLAFTDKGAKLKAESNNQEVIKSILSIAEARDWEAIAVTGTKDFRREVWREASLRGLEVHGYEPSELDRAELKRALEKRYGPNEVVRDAPQRTPTEYWQEEPQRAVRNPSKQPDSARAADSADSPATHRENAQDRQPGRENVSQPRDAIRAGVTVGTLIEHGAAPYKFNDDNDMNYYVKLQTNRGERTLWGVDLERAVAESKTSAQIGDVVGVENLGNRPVTVKVRKRDNEGREVVEEIQTHRNAWVVEAKEYFQEQSAKAEAVRTNGHGARLDLAKQHPELAETALILSVGDKVAASKFEREEDRARFRQALQETLAQAVEQGEPIGAKKLRQEMARGAQATKAPQHEHEHDEPPAASSRANSRGPGRKAPPHHVQEPEVPPHVR